MAASAALPAFGCTTVPTTSPAGPRPNRVAIVGGGLSGLIALRDLREAGVDARLYEARDRLGGRVSTFYGGPVPADDGGQYVNSDHADILGLVKRYGLRLVDRSQVPGQALLVADGRVIREAELAEDLRDIAAQIGRDAAAVDADFRSAAPEIDAMSLAQYLDRHSDKLRKPYLRALLEASVRTEFGQEPGEASALELLFNLPVVDGREVEVIGSSDERYVVEGGSSMMANALASELATYAELSQVLTAVEPAGEGVRLRFASGATVEADRAIITLPAAVLRTVEFGALLPAPWRQYVAEAGCGRNEKLNATYRARPWSADMGRAGAVWALPGGFSELWDAGNVPSDTGLLTYFMGGDQCTASERRELAELRRTFEGQAAPAVPGLSDAASGWQRRTHWVNDRFSRGAYSCFRPGQLTRYASLFWIEDEQGRPSQVAGAGPLLFAGEHLSDAWTGFMNGAAQTGRLAAAALVAARVPERAGERVPA